MYRHGPLKPQLCQRKGNEYKAFRKTLHFGQMADAKLVELTYTQVRLVMIGSMHRHRQFRRASIPNVLVHVSQIILHVHEDNTAPSRFLGKLQCYVRN